MRLAGPGDRDPVAVLVADETPVVDVEVAGRVLDALVGLAAVPLLLGWLLKEVFETDRFMGETACLLSAEVVVVDLLSAEGILLSAEIGLLSTDACRLKLFELDGWRDALRGRRVGLTPVRLGSGLRLLGGRKPSPVVATSTIPSLISSLLTISCPL